MAERLTIKQWRNVRDISQNEMANRLNVHVNTYRVMERYPMKVRLYTLLKICKILKVSIKDLNLIEEEPGGLEEVE